MSQHDDTFREEASAFGQRVKGAAKDAAGAVTGDRRLEREGEIENAAGRARQASNDVFDETDGVPGATVQLAGSYNLRSEEIAFAGDLLLDANLRRTMSGWKSIMGFIAQPFFRRPGGGSKLPIRISGTRSNPTFGLDVKKALLPG